MDALRALDSGLDAPRAELASWGVPLPAGGGQQIRPLVSWAVARELGTTEDRAFWHAAFAVQLAHEASLLHDDVIDVAVERRGAPTVAASKGVGPAVVAGDHLLTAGYRMAADTGSAAYVRVYAEAVERTVAGEVAQARARGRVLTDEEYRDVVGAKSGELLGLAAAAPALLVDDPRAGELRELGRALGVLYQMLDDLLDYCPAAVTGKAALKDHAQGHWTWALDGLGDDVLGLPTTSVLARLHAPGADGVSPLRSAVTRYAEEVRRFLAAHRALLPNDPVMPALVRGWQARVRESVAREEVLNLASAVAADDVELARHSRSFSFAASFFPAAERRRVAAVYAFCRFTDDLVDRAGSTPRPVLGERLDAWLALARACYEGEEANIGFLQRSVGEMRAAGVPFDCAAELIAGVRMDLSRTRWETMDELRRYCHGVASSVGVWLTHMFGVHDAWTLRRASALGRAMQLTNVLRDVGEDLDRGRVYVPRELLARFGVSEADLSAMRAGAPIRTEWRSLVEHLIGEAEADYAEALRALPRLPRAFRVPVGVAAHVYRGIHDAIRANGYDNLTRRAHTSGLAKLRLALGALRRPRSVPRRVPSPLATALAAVLLSASGAAAQNAAAVPGTAPDIAGEAARPPNSPVPGALDRLLEIESRMRERPDSVELGVDRVRALYFVGVDDGDAADEGLGQVELLRATGRVEAAVLDAYQGAFETLRAKHAFWPVTKLRRARAGLDLLDRAVAAAPAVAEIRWLRLMGGFYLPSFFGRGAQVEEDLRTLAQLLAEEGHAVAPELHRAMLDFVLRHAERADAAAARLRGGAGVPP
jgi:phytoene synthase